VIERETTVDVTGDPLPESVATIVGELAAGGPVDVSLFGADATYAYGADPESEVVPRTVVTGRQAIPGAIAADLRPAEQRPELLVCVASATDCLVEGRLVDRATGQPTATIAASFQLDEVGRIARVLTFRCLPVEPSPSWETDDPSTTHDARAILDTYFAELDAAHLDAAAATFSDDVLYSHPPYWPGAPRAAFRGKAELVEGFARRGPRTNRHELTVCLQSGRECLIEGYSHKPDKGISGQFVSSLTLADDGRIQRYLALYFEPSIGRR
jgi:SnoaL-like domain